MEGQGAQALCNSSRQSLLSNAVGKVWHRGIRARLLPAVRAYSRGAVFNLGAAGVDMAAHLPRAAADWAASQGMSSAVLCVDVAGAYYHAIRELAVSMPPGAGIEAMTGELGLSARERGELAELIAGAVATREAEAPTHAAALAAEALVGTWFSVDGAAELARTRRGVRPGDPLADVLYMFIAARCLRQVRDELRSAGLMPSLAWHAPDAGGRPSLAPLFGADGAARERIELSDALYADDDAFMIVAPAMLLTARLVEAATIVAKGFGRHGLTLNFGAGKTEAVCRFAGPGAKAAARELDEGGSRLALPDLADGSLVLRTVPAYKHMGSIFDRKGSELPDAAARKRAAAPERRSLRPFSGVLTSP